MCSSNDLTGLLEELSGWFEAEANVEGSDIAREYQRRLEAAIRLLKQPFAWVASLPGTGMYDIKHPATEAQKVALKRHVDSLHLTDVKIEPVYALRELPESEAE